MYLRDVEAHAAEALADAARVRVVVLRRERHERHIARCREHAADVRLGMVEKPVAVRVPKLEINSSRMAAECIAVSFPE